MIGIVAIPALSAAIIGLPTVITLKVGWVLATILTKN